MSILVLGDFGNGNEGQYEVANLLYFLSNKYNTQLILGLGDNIYPDGVRKYNNIQFYTKFHNPYSKLDKKLKFYNVLGNHDYHYNPEEQIKHTRSKYNINKRWNLPNFFYNFKKKINGKTVEFIAIDTNLDTMPQSRIKQQEKWLKKTLKHSKADWVIVFGHHPWKSTGSHGNCNTVLNELYKMISDTNKVDLMLAGHDHDNQHLSILNKPELIISGTGSTKRNMFIRPKSRFLKYFDEQLGCCMITFKDNQLIVQFYSTDQKLNYTLTIVK